MERTHLWELMISLNTSELRRSRQFLDLPEVNRRADVCALHDALVACRKREQPPERMPVYAAIFGDETAYDDQAFRLVQSYLYRCLERFLVWEEGNFDADTAEPLLLRAYRKRRLDRHLLRALKRQRSAAAKRPVDNAETRLADHLRTRERATLLARAGRARELNLQEVEDSLDLAFYAFKLRQACFTRSHESVFDVRYEPRLLPTILAATAHQTTPAIAVYRTCYLALFEQPDDATFRAFRDQLRLHAAGFPAEESRSLYLLALNYCIRRINANDTPYLREALELYTTGLRSRVLLENGQISRFSFNNAIGIALRLDELDQAADLLEAYSDTLDPTYRQATEAFNRARLAFAQQRFEYASDQLRLVDAKDPIHAMNARILQLKIYFSTDDRYLFDQFLRTTRQFVRRHTRSYHHRLWRDILRYLTKLYDLNPHDRRAKTDLRAAIIAEPQLMERRWLLKQLE